MRNTILALGALALSVGVAAPVFAGDFTNNERGPSLEERTKDAGVSHTATFGYPGSASAHREAADFRIVYVGELSTAEANPLNNASADQRASAQAAAQSNAGVASELAARGISLQNVVGVSTSFNGRTVVYVK